MTNSKCKICEATEEESDLERCADCGHLFCDDCLEWCCNEHDELNGDWFCEECASK